MATTNMTITVEEFRRDFPEFTEALFPNETVELFIGRAKHYFSLKHACGVCPEDQRYAVELLTAHMLILYKENPSGLNASYNAGMKQSAQVGDVSVSYAVPTVKNMLQAWLAQTQKGLELLALMRKYAITPIYKGGTFNRVFRM